MPPAQAACKACRQSKTKCDITTVAPEKCSRCTRIGLACIPCEPSRRGQSHPNRVISKLGKANRALLEVDPSTLPKPTKKAAPPRSDPTTFTYSMAPTRGISAKVASNMSATIEMDPATGVNWRSLNCSHGKPVAECTMCAKIRKLCYNWTSVAGRKNSHRMLSSALGLAAMCDIPVVSVLSPRENGITLLEMSSRCPPVVAELLASQGYCWARGVVSDPAMGEVGGFITNAYFNEVVCDSTHLATAWRESGGANSMVEIFLHPDDVTIFIDLFELLLKQSDLSREAIQGESNSVVRLMDQRIAEYVQCTARVLVLANDQTLWLAAQFVPIDIATPRTENADTLEPHEAGTIDQMAIEATLVGSVGSMGSVGSGGEGAAGSSEAAEAGGIDPVEAAGMALTAEELRTMIDDVENSIERHKGEAQTSKMASTSPLASTSPPGGPVTLETQHSFDKHGNAVMWSYDELATELNRTSVDAGRFSDSR